MRAQIGDLNVKNALAAGLCPTARMRTRIALSFNGAVPWQVGEEKGAKENRKEGEETETGWEGTGVEKRALKRGLEARGPRRRIAREI